MKSVVLLSGGLDSAVSFACALQETEVILSLTFDYGQRAAAKEQQAAAALSSHYNIGHRTLEVPFLKEITNTALVSEQAELPLLSTAELDDYSLSSASAASVWVPNRNGLFINIAACFAEALQCDLIVTGFNREEAATFPDNSAEFVKAANSSLSYSTINKVRVVSYTQRLDKVEIIQLGLKLVLPFKYIWSCYRGESKACGRCESCLRFARAAKAAGMVTQ